MSPGAAGVAAGHVLASGHHAHHVHLEAERHHRFQGAEHAGGTAHVELHLVHGWRWLDGDAAGVEGDAFAHQHPGPLALGAAVVFHHDELRRLAAAAATASRAPIPSFFICACSNTVTLSLPPLARRGLHPRDSSGYTRWAAGCPGSRQGYAAGQAAAHPQPSSAACALPWSRATSKRQLLQHRFVCPCWCPCTGRSGSRHPRPLPPHGAPASRHPRPCSIERRRGAHRFLHARCQFSARTVFCIALR